MATADFGRKFSTVLKTLNLSRGRLAQSVGIDKSVVSRWASGVQVPTDHNLSLLTEAVARHQPGFARRDWDLDADAFAARLVALETTETNPDRPSIAVLPFVNMSGDSEREYFADGVVEDIITALSRFKSLFVIARNSSFTYKGKTVDVRQVGRELGVRYILEGSVRAAGGRLRITGQLVESATRAHLWADRFDGSLEDVFELQDRITTSVVGAIAPKLDRAEIERARRKPAENLDAYDCFLRGLAMTHMLTRESYDGAMHIFYRAIDLEPNFSTPYGLIALCYATRKSAGWAVDTEREEAETARLASHVSRDGDDDALALCTSGYALTYVCRDYEAGVALIDRGLGINQNLAFGWQCRGWASVLLGQHEAALEQLARTLRLNPLDPQSFAAERGMAAALMHLERYDEAVKWAARALAHEPGDIRVLRTSASIYALAGRLDEARGIMAYIRRLHPAMRLSQLGDLVGLSRQQDIERLIRGLRLAGMPE